LGTRGKVFISYRRDDAPGDARGLCERLASKFGKANVFMDVDNLLAGQRFDRELEKALAQCDVLIAVIGPRWMKLLSAHTRSSERDYVHDEIAAALKRNITVIPALVGRKGHMPALPLKDSLPEDIRALVLHQKQDIAHESFGRDADELVRAVKAVLRGKHGASSWLPMTAAGAIGLTLLAALFGYWMDMIPGVNSGPRALQLRSSGDREVKAAEQSKTAAEEAAKVAAAAEATRKAADAQRQADAEAAGNKSAQEAKRRADEDAAAVKAVEDLTRKKVVEEAARRAAEEAQRQADADAARKKAADETKRKAEEDAAAIKAAEDRARKAVEEAARRAAEEARHKADADAADAARRKLDAERAVRPPRPTAPSESCARNGYETYCVSSVLKPQFGNSYGPSNLFAGSDSVAWVEGKSGHGIGEWIAIEFESMRTVRSVVVRNGYQKSNDIFQKNNRVRQMRVLFSQGETHTLTLQDRFGSELHSFPKPIQAYWVKFVIDDVWAGNKYSDTAITKLLVNSERVK